MRTTICGDGQVFKMELWGSRSRVLVHKTSGRYAFISGAKATRRLFRAMEEAPQTRDVDVFYGWIWTNAGFHRLAAS